MKELWNKHHDKIITFLLFAVLFTGVVAVIAVFGGAIMKIFGFEYKSIGSIILFFIIAAIVSFPLGLVAGALPKVLLFFGKLSKSTAVILYIVLDTMATFFGLNIVDYFMETVSATDSAILIVSLLLSLFGINDIDKKPKGID